MSTPGRYTHTGRSRKKILQRLYRSTEAEDFSQLRQIIREITQENPNTRHDILRKAAEIIRQLDTEYRSLLLEDQQAASTSNSTTSSASSPMQHLAPLDPAVSHFPPQSWSVNYDHPTPMHPYMPSSSYITHSMYAPGSLSSMDDAIYNHVHFNG
ncbi:hypothetical protein EDB19DRAFT_1742773 [Suillus lakei]|nr:hypothetical protein EDB19DRAFT_1742773 [Suillus lakei]